MLTIKNNLTPDQKEIKIGPLKCCFDKARVTAFCILLLILLLSTKAHATAYTWNGPPGVNWTTVSNRLPVMDYPDSGPATTGVSIINTHYVTIDFTGNSTAYVFNPVTNQYNCPHLIIDTPAVQNMYNQILRLKLSIDSLNFDDIVIGFTPGCSAKYNPNVDAEYFPGIDAPEGLASFSGDGIPLSINFLPYPKLVQEVIRLKISSANSGQFDLKRTEFANIPPLYEAWLIDKFKNDSLDIQNNSDYVFTIDKTDSATFGNNRFTVVIRQNQALMVHLLSFNGTKSTGGPQLVWTTENEQNYTGFAIERSIDNGISFSVLGGFASDARATYSFTDDAPAGGVNSYRLKMTDLNGSVTYSEVINLNYPGQNGPMASNISIYPNPARSVINLSVIQASNTTTTPGTSPLAADPLKSVPGGTGNPVLYDIRIVNIAGMVIKTANAAAANWQTNVDSLSPGSYIIQVVNTDDKSLVGRSTFIKL